MSSIDELSARTNRDPGVLPSQSLPHSLHTLPSSPHQATSSIDGEETTTQRDTSSECTAQLSPTSQANTQPEIDVEATLKITCHDGRQSITDCQKCPVRIDDDSCENHGLACRTVTENTLERPSQPELPDSAADSREQPTRLPSNTNRILPLQPSGKTSSTTAEELNKKEIGTGDSLEDISINSLCLKSDSISLSPESVLVDLATEKNAKYETGPPEQLPDIKNQERRQTPAETRKIGACIRCRIQKLQARKPPSSLSSSSPSGSNQKGYLQCKTNFDSDVYTEEECIPCKNFAKHSKKTLHRSPCDRRKIGAITLFRQEGLRLTRRWPATEIKDVNGRGVLAQRHIGLTFDVSTEPIYVPVVPFVPVDGDITTRSWTVSINGKTFRRQEELPAYCLHDVRAAAKEYASYVFWNAPHAFLRYGARRAVSRQDDDPHDDIIGKTFLLAMEHLSRLWKDVEPADMWDIVTDGNKEAVEGADKKTRVLNGEKRMLGHLFSLWFAWSMWPITFSDSVVPRGLVFRPRLMGRRAYAGRTLHARQRQARHGVCC